MNMRKTVFAVIAAMAMAAAFAQGKNAIAVPAPKAVNLGEGTDWIPLFIQGIITTNFQQYSGLTVIDRQNADMVKAEQRLSEGAEFDEKNAIELGKMTSARLIITGNIVAKSASYALTFSITDAESGETKATASVPDCPRSALEDGTAANKISYDLMAGYGIALGDDTRVKLTRTATLMTSETSAQMSVAKGIAAEKGGSNIEALTYYIQAKKNDRNLAEATSRMAGMTTVVTGGNFGANAKNLMKLRNDWDKLLLEAAGLIAANPPEFELRYFTDIEPLELTEADYENGTMSFRMGAPYLKQISGEENAKIAGELMGAMQQIEQSKNWGEKINGFPWTYANDIPGDHWLKWVNEENDNIRIVHHYYAKVKNYSFSVSLLDADKKVIAKKPYTLSVAYGRKFTRFKIASDNEEKIYYYSLPSLTISDVPVGNADTDKIYISVENAGSQKISVLPTDALPFDKAISVLKAGNHNGTVKISGFVPSISGYPQIGSLAEALKSGGKPVALDLSELDDVTVITRNFNGCTSLTSIILPKNVTEIAKDAFRGCKSLESVTMPDGVTEIGESAFVDCKSLKSVTIPVGVTKIGMHPFSGCTSLKSVTIPEGITSITPSMFSDCTSLESVMIPAGVTEISMYAFRQCTSLKSVSIPKSVTNIGHRAFRDCPKLKDVRYGSTTKQWKLIDKYNSKDDVGFWDNSFEKGVIVHCTDGDIAWNARD